MARIVRAVAPKANLGAAPFGGRREARPMTAARPLLPTSVIGSHGLPGWVWLAREAIQAGRLGATDLAELRGSGHLLGIRCHVTAGDFVAKLRTEGLLCLTAGENVLRILPPLVASESEIDEGLGIIERVARQWPAT